MTWPSRNAALRCQGKHRAQPAPAIGQLDRQSKLGDGMNEDKYWFLCYRIDSKPDKVDAPYSTTTNVVLANIHPLEWLSNPPDSFRERYVQTALFFHEIDAATFSAVVSLNYISHEQRPVKASVSA